MLKNAILFFSTPPFLDLQGFLMVVLLSMSCLSFGSKITSVATYDVTSYGAKGDGNTDDSSVIKLIISSNFESKEIDVSCKLKNAKIS